MWYRSDAKGALSAQSLFGLRDRAGRSERRTSRVAQELARVSVAIQNALLYRKAEDQRVEAEESAAQLRRVNDELGTVCLYRQSRPAGAAQNRREASPNRLERRYRDQLPQDARDYIAHMVEGARRMSHLIRDLLEYSRVTRTEEPAGVPVKMDDVLAASVASLHTAALESGAVITIGEIPILVRGSAPQLQQLLINLLGNAIKYARPEVPPIIHVHAEREDSSWHFIVRDNGEGFDPAYQERIFGVFRRLQGRDVPGTGIGLALCRRIVERHGGRIWAESTPGVGSRFHFTIPDSYKYLRENSSSSLLRRWTGVRPDVPPDRACAGSKKAPGLGQPRAVPRANRA